MSQINSSFLFQNRKVTEYHELDPYDIEEKKDTGDNFINKKQIGNFTTIKAKIFKFFSNFKNFYFNVMNSDEENIRNLFYIVLFVFWVENLLCSLSELYIVRISICVLFLMPPLIILFENPNFAKINSVFEMKNFMTIKALIVFNKNLNFVEILISSILMNLFHTYFKKGYYIKSAFLGIEIKDKKLRKINQFKSNFKFLILGFITNSIWFAFIFKKLEFYMFDESKQHLLNNLSLVLNELNISDANKRKFIYYSAFVFFSSRILIKNLFKLNKSQFHFDLIDKPFKYIISFFIFQMAMSYVLTSTFYSFLISFTVMIIFSFIHSNLGFFVIPLMLVYYLIGIILNIYLHTYFIEKEIVFIKSNFKISNLSLLLSVLFIMIVYYEAELVRIYYEIHSRIFCVKIIFDFFLIVNFVYSLYDQFEENYIEMFNKSYKIIFLILSIHYLLIYLALLAKLTLKIEDKTIDSFFPELKSESGMEYNKNTPYFEIRFNKRSRFVLSLFSKSIDNLTKSALKNLQTFIIGIITVFLCFVINNSVIFFLAYLALIQLLHKTYFKYLIRDVLEFVNKMLRNYNFEELEFADVKFTSTSKYKSKSKTGKSPLSSFSASKKYKLLYIYFYPYLNILWKIMLSKIIILSCEVLFTWLNSLNLGELEPCSNTIYHFLLSNSKSPANYFSFLDYFSLLFMIIPNTILILYTHFTGAMPSFILQNLSVLNLFSYYINGSFDIMIMGVLNLLVTISIIAADEETYEQFNLWFDALGITPHF